MLKALTRLLRVFLMINPKQVYVKSMVHHVLTLLYWKKERDRLPFWDLFCKDPAMFDEEPGEISFSLLGRAMANDTKKHEVEHASKKYRNVRLYLDTHKDLLQEHYQDDTARPSAAATTSSLEARSSVDAKPTCAKSEPTSSTTSSPSTPTQKP